MVFGVRYDLYVVGCYVRLLHVTYLLLFVVDCWLFDMIECMFIVGCYPTPLMHICVVRCCLYMTECLFIMFACCILFDVARSL